DRIFIHFLENLGPHIDPGVMGYARSVFAQGLDINRSRQNLFRRIGSDPVDHTNIVDDERMTGTECLWIVIILTGAPVRAKHITHIVMRTCPACKDPEIPWITYAFK